MLEKYLWNGFFTVSTSWHSATLTGNKHFPRGAIWCFKSTSKNSQINIESSTGILSKDVLKKFAKLTENHLCRSLFFNKVTDWKPESTRSTYQRCSGKKVILKNLLSLTGKHLSCSHFLIKLHFWDFSVLLKKFWTHMFSCESCKIFINNYFEEQLWNAS